MGKARSWGRSLLQAAALAVIAAAAACTAVWWVAAGGTAGSTADPRVAAVRAAGQQDRIAGKYPDESEGDDRYADEGGNEQADAARQVAEHLSLPAEVREETRSGFRLRPP